MVQVFKVAGAFDAALFGGCSCAFGVFDGMHAGHRHLLGCARKTADESGGKAVALTFDIDPDELFRPSELRKIMRNDDRIAALAASGVDAVAVLPFTRDFAAEAPAEFLQRTFGGAAPAHVHVGANFRFGAKAAGTAAFLREWGASRGMSVHAHELLAVGDMPVSATRIRGLLAQGRIEEANELLCAPYTLHETVAHGRAAGRDMGFRTANLQVPAMRCALADGVYAARAVVDGKAYAAAVAMGESPTFAEEAAASCEAHILDFSGDLYGKDIRVEFLHRLRDMMIFASQEDLVRTVQGNIEWVRENVRV